MLYGQLNLGCIPLGKWVIPHVIHGIFPSQIFRLGHTWMKKGLSPPRMMIPIDLPSCNLTQLWTFTIFIGTANQLFLWAILYSYVNVQQRVVLIWVEVINPRFSLMAPCLFDGSGTCLLNMFVWSGCDFPFSIEIDYLSLYDFAIMNSFPTSKSRNTSV